MPDRRPKRDKETPRKEKLCKTCARAFSWNERRAQDWDIASYCSQPCSGYASGERAAELEIAILELLSERGPGNSICPSEVAKLVGGSAARRDWEGLMVPAREAARRLARAGRIVVTQKDTIVDASRARGPIRLRLR